MVIMRICFKAVCKAQSILPDVLFSVKESYYLASDQTKLGPWTSLINKGKRALQITPNYTINIFLYLLCFTLNTSLQSLNIAFCALTYSSNMCIFVPVTDLVHC